MLSPLLQLALIVGIGIGAQWLGWRLRIPSILFLLLAGWCAGPLTGIIQPDALLGELLMPVVALSVGLILFEGGMSLQYREIAVMGTITWRLVTLGALVTWALAAISAYLVLDFSWPVALLTGAILVVTGPTVIGPLLRHIRPTPQAASVLKWEGIVIDPIGALLAVLVFESAAHVETSGPAMIAINILKTIIVGGLLGGAGAAFLLLALRRFWIPDYLQSPATLALVLVVFAISNELQHEAGLLATTIMGIIIANQRQVVVRHVIQFKENLRVLLLALLFILLSARLDFDYINTIDLRAVGFVLVLVLVVRPLSVWISTIGTSMPRNERLLIAWVAPRGIVAAAITSVFAVEMVEAGYEDAERMVPVMFLVIAATVTIYGLTAAPLARFLGVSQPEPRGLLLAGAHEFARSLAKLLKENGVETLLVDRNWSHVATARIEGLHAQHGDILDEALLDDMVSRGLGRLLALTPNDKVNSLAALHYSELLDHKDIYQIAEPKSSALGQAQMEIPRHLRGRTLFSDAVSFEQLEELTQAGYRLKATSITPAFSYEDYQKAHSQKALPLLLVKDGVVDVIFTAGDKPRASAGSKLIGLTPPVVEAV